MEFEQHMEKRMESRVRRGVAKGVKILGFTVLGILLLLAFGYLFMLLWNWLMPDLFGLPEVGYWKALGILILAKILFGFGGSGSSKSGKSKPQRKWRGDCRKQGEDRWQYYDQFWNEEGEAAFENYIARKTDEQEGAAPTAD